MPWKYISDSSMPPDSYHFLTAQLAVDCLVVLTWYYVLECGVLNTVLHGSLLYQCGVLLLTIFFGYPCAANKNVYCEVLK